VKQQFPSSFEITCSIFIILFCLEYSVQNTGRKAGVDSQGGETMSTTARRWRLAGLLVLAAALATGCNLPAMIYFLVPHGDPREGPQLIALEPEERGKEIRVVILANSGIETRPEFITADRDLTSLLSQQLQQSFKDDNKKLKIPPAAKVQEFKNNHPDWHMDLAQVGKHFAADYVISLEIGSLSLYENGSQGTLYLGRANVEVAVLNMHKPDESPEPLPFSCKYPRSRGPIPVDGTTSPRMFYMAFMKYVAKQLSWYFVPHEIDKEFDKEINFE
jgi:hypothetical protein